MITALVHFHTTGVHNSDYPLRVGVFRQGDELQGHTEIVCQLPEGVEITREMMRGIEYCRYGGQQQDQTKLDYPQALRAFTDAVKGVGQVFLYGDFGERFCLRLAELGGGQLPFDRYTNVKNLQARMSADFGPGRWGALKNFAAQVGVDYDPAHMRSQLALFAVIQQHTDTQPHDFVLLKPLSGKEEDA